MTGELLPDCSCCRKVTQAAEGGLPHLIHAFPHTLWVVGAHDFHRGYTMLILRSHVKDMHELEPAVQEAVFRELMMATTVAASVFQPWKMNHSCYGNVVPHVHWHIFPRYRDDPDWLAHPWLHQEKFDNHRLGDEAAAATAAVLREALATSGLPR